MSSSPAAEIEVDLPLVRSLLRAQMPELAAAKIKIVAQGWDNVMVRLGESHALRLPRRRVAEPLILHEQRWLSELAPHLPLAVPVPTLIGVPQADYPFHWSLQHWLPGRAADLAPPRADQAGVLAKFLLALQAIPLPDNAPQNSHRGVALAALDAQVSTRLARLSGVSLAALHDIWRAGVAARPASHSVWLAADIHARNVLVDAAGALTAMIDWGDMCAGDPAVDLASVWHLLPTREARNAALSHFGADAALINRAKAWAVHIGAILLETGLRDTPRHAEMGRRVLARVLEDQGSFASQENGRSR